MPSNANVCLDFDLFMNIIFHTTQQGITYGQNISTYLFNVMREEFIFRKYGDDGKKRFYDTFSLCIYMNDTDMIGAYWENMKTTEKKKWLETPNEITDLEKFFT